MTRALKTLAAAVLGSEFAVAPRLWQLAQSRDITILNFHRVDDKGISAYEAMSPAVFDDLVRWLCDKFTLTTFGEVNEIRGSDKPPLILSFDDGYKDFIEVVGPILERYAVKANINVVPVCIDSQRPPHTVLLQDFIGAAPESLLVEVHVPGLPRLQADNRLVCARRAAAALKRHTIAEQDRVMNELERYFARLDSFQTTPMLTRDDIRELVGHHEVGAHSYCHATMAAQSDAYAGDDASSCIEYFDTRFGCRPIVYAFPNGVARRAQAELVQRAGFQHVLLTGSTVNDQPSWLHSRRLVYGPSVRGARFRALGMFPSRAPAVDEP